MLAGRDKKIISYFLFFGYYAIIISGGILKMPKQTSKNIIVMEDDVAMAEIVTHKLESSGFAVRHAEDGKQGLQMISEAIPDLILLDLMMPEVDGFQVLETIRKSPDKKIANLAVIVLSNLWSNSDILRVKNLRADDYLVKAYFTPEEILGKIQAVLEKHNN
jgi:DNA-binding response OmpR family regulator